MTFILAHPWLLSPLTILVVLSAIVIHAYISAALAAPPADPPKEPTT